MKKDIKKTLKIAGTLFLFLCIFQIVMFALKVYSVQTGAKQISYLWLNYMLDIIEITLSLLTCIIYFVQSQKSHNDIVKQNKLFFGLCMANVLNSLAGWVISFWIQIAVAQASRFEFSFINPFEDASSSQEDVSINKNNNKNRNDIIMDESGYEVLHTETLKTRLDELNRMRSKNEITQEEYSRLRQEAIDEFLN